MTMPDLVADLKASLQDSASFFTAANDADFERHMTNAALDFGRVRRRTLVGSVALVVNTDDYQAPADLLFFKAPIWGVGERRSRQPWDKTWPGRLPVVTVYESAAGRMLHMVPAPTQAQIDLLGATFRFYYFAGHVIDANDATKTSIQPGDRALLLLRAQAESMKEASMRNIARPVALRDGMSQVPRNGIPAALYQQLMGDFERQAVI